jgi:hypothetical protein
MPVMGDDGDEELYVGSEFLYNDTLFYICIQLAFLFVKILLVILVIQYLVFFFLGILCSRCFRFGFGLGSIASKIFS